MTDEQRKRVHAITYSTQDRMELAERIVRLEDERDLYSSLVEDMDHPDTANQLREENAKLREENAQLKDENEKLTTLVCHLMYVKPRDVTGIMYKGEVLHFDKLLEEVGLRWEDA